MTQGVATASRTRSSSAAQSWMRALELTAPISLNPDRLMLTLVGELAERYGDSPALLSDREQFSYRELHERANRYARWALEQGIGKGDVVCLLMTNRPEYFAFWLGVTGIGAVVALLNTNLVGPSLAHCVRVVRPKHCLVSGELISSYDSALMRFDETPKVWAHGVDNVRYPRLDKIIDNYSGEPAALTERPHLTIDDLALYIYTSGTTGLPKATNISHGRVLQWTHWFAGMMDFCPDDRIYDCLPMYHSIGGVLAPGAALVGGGSAVIGDKFSASQFWNDIVRWDCTIFQYIGEFCRYLLHSPISANERSHRIRMACGNGLAADTWQDFRDRFDIRRILEFYASTEGAVSLFNVEEKPGAIGRVPPYLTHRFSPVLVRFDVEQGEPIRDNNGFCVRCSANESGEALGKLTGQEGNVTNRFEGYSEDSASERKILRNVFEPDDVWFRTGDLMRRDEAGYFYFVDRIGDTFRWRGENVATSEVAEALCSFPGVFHAAVYGVQVPGTDGKAGMAAIVSNLDIDLFALLAHLSSRLPAYARPLFLRIQEKLDVTGTLKYSKTGLVRQGFDPSTTQDTIYVNHPGVQSYIRLDPNLHGEICRGTLRL